MSRELSSHTLVSSSGDKNCHRDTSVWATIVILMQVCDIYHNRQFKSYVGTIVISDFQNNITEISKSKASKISVL